jgi:vesicular inhibitory amino acid transporter
LEFVVIAVALMKPPADPPHTEFFVSDVLSFGGAFASFAFAYGMHPILPTVYADMRYPHKFRQMIIFAFILVFAMYLPMLCVGYSVYGDEVPSPIYKEKSMTGGVVLFVIIAMTFPALGGYAIVINPVERALEDTLGLDHWKSPLLSRIGVRSCFMVFTATVSILLQEKFPPLLNLVASCTSTFTQYIFPCLFYLKLCSMARVRVSLLEKVWNGLILLCATVGAIFGTIGALRQIFA